MDVFISWSGTRSEAVAQALRDCLPLVIQVLRPWISVSDIEKGTRWSTEFASSLEKCSVGIICLTPKNLNAPWLLFEAGAISKKLENTYVIPYLFEFNPAQLAGPLTQFQAVKSEKEDTRSLLQTINRALGEGALGEVVLEQAFEKWWPDLEAIFQAIPPPEEDSAPQRADRELLAHISQMAEKAVA
jgi:hypothetical protein